MTISDIIRRMEAGEKLRWVLKSEVDRLSGNPDDVDTRELWIGRDRVPHRTALDVFGDLRIQELPGNEKNDQEVIDYELIT